MVLKSNTNAAEYWLNERKIEHEATELALKFSEDPKDIVNFFLAHEYSPGDGIHADYKEQLSFYCDLCKQRRQENPELYDQCIKKLNRRISELETTRTINALQNTAFTTIITLSAFAVIGKCLKTLISHFFTLSYKDIKDIEI